MIKYQAPSGALVEINLVDFDTAYDLQTAIIKAIREGGLINVNEIDLSNVYSADWRPFAGMFMDVLISKEVKEMIFKVLEKCTYKDKKGEERITKETFEAEDRRGDFFDVAFKVATENVRPFWSRLFSRLQAEVEKKKSSPASK
jgi:hypothetical protein